MSSAEVLESPPMAAPSDAADDQLVQRVPEVEEEAEAGMPEGQAPHQEQQDPAAAAPIPAQDVFSEPQVLQHDVDAAGASASAAKKQQLQEQQQPDLAAAALSPAEAKKQQLARQRALLQGLVQRVEALRGMSADGDRQALQASWQALQGEVDRGLQMVVAQAGALLAPASRADSGGGAAPPALPLLLVPQLVLRQAQQGPPGLQPCVLAPETPTGGSSSGSGGGSEPSLNCDMQTSATGSEAVMGAHAASVVSPAAPPQALLPTPAWGADGAATPPAAEEEALLPVQVLVPNPLYSCMRETMSPSASPRTFASGWQHLATKPQGYRHRLASPETGSGAAEALGMPATLLLSGGAAMAAAVALPEVRHGDSYGPSSESLAGAAGGGSSATGREAASAQGLLVVVDNPVADNVADVHQWMMGA